MTSEAKRIGLFGLFGVGNFGNDGSLESALRFLRKVAPDEDLICICGDPAAVEQSFDLNAIPIYYQPRPAVGKQAPTLVRKTCGKALLWFHAVRHLRRIRVLIVPGTGVLDDFGAWPLSWPYDLFSWFVAARLMGVRIVFASIGAGPIRHPLSRWLMKSAARTAHYRSYRDMHSKEFMESIGFDTSDDPVYPDLAFALPAPAQTRRRDAKDQRLRIGVGLMTYHGWRNHRARGAEIYDAYLEKMAGFVVWLLDRDHDVRLLMGDEVDRRAVDDLLGAVRARRPDRSEDSVVFAAASTLRGVMQQMADTDLVVATRYHNVVCALRMGKPTISVGYAKKNDVLLAEAGLGDYCQHIEALDLELLKAQTMRMVSELPAIETRVCQAAARFQSSLREQEDLLAPLIGGDAGSTVRGRKPVTAPVA